jgi:hypothetical protein
MTTEESAELWQYVWGGQFVGRARNMLFDFLHARGWDDRESQNEAIRIASERHESEAQRRRDAARSG